jgi:transcriptional regulator with XRE-family HTH domain
MTGNLSEDTANLSVSQEERVVAAIRAARFAIGWSQADMAAASGVSEVSIARMEAGLISPRLSTITKVQTSLELAGVQITLNQPTGGFSLAVDSGAVAESRRRYGAGRTRKTTARGSHPDTGGSSSHKREEKA